MVPGVAWAEKGCFLRLGPCIYAARRLSSVRRTPHSWKMQQLRSPARISSSVSVESGDAGKITNQGKRAITPGFQSHFPTIRASVIGFDPKAESSFQDPPTATIFVRAAVVAHEYVAQLRPDSRLCASYIEAKYRKRHNTITCSAPGPAPGARAGPRAQGRAHAPAKGRALR